MSPTSRCQTRCLGRLGLGLGLLLNLSGLGLNPLPGLCLLVLESDIPAWLAALKRQQA